MNQIVLKATLALFCLFTFTPAFAQHQEEILDFKSHIMVNTDASIDVAEEITVYAAGDVIKRGLVRWLPTKYTDSYGIRRQTEYRLRQVLLNNQDSPYHIKREDGKFAIYVGEKDVYLSPGIYTYTLLYHVDNAVNFLQDGDEIYWNVTGNNWVFPIQKASAFVRLPENANILSFRGYTGATGEQGTDYSTKKIADNEVEFSAGYLPPGSGLTIAVAWPKGIVKEPTLTDRLGRSFEYNRGQYIVLELAVLAFIYYLIVWNWYGRDPAKGTIIPLFEPPAGFSPAAVRYILQMGADMKCFTAALISIATKGALTIKDSAGDFTLEKADSADKLAVEEQALYLKLFSGANEIILSSTNAPTFRTANSTLANSLKEHYQSPYFVTNIVYLVPGILLTLTAFAVAALSADEPAAALFAVVWLSIWTGGCLFLLYTAYTSFCLLRTYFTFTNLFRAVFLTLFAVPFLGGELAGLTLMASTMPIFTVPLLFFIATLNIIYYHLMKQPSKEGRRIMDQIEGFKLFLSTTERYRINQLHAPEITPQLFEKWLPYAIALDVESQWGERFNSQLASAGIDPNTYHPVWYHGNAWSASNIAAFPAYLSSSLGSSLASTTVSSSASGGGGSSGGGGGGGGGGGW